MKTIIEFINDLSSNDIDLYNKLDNLCGHGQISDTVYKLCQDEETFDIIEHYVREILQDDIGDTELAEEYINFIIEETENLYEQELINEPDDFASGSSDVLDSYPRYELPDESFLRKTHCNLRILLPQTGSYRYYSF